MSEEKKGGYTTIVLGTKLLDAVKNHSDESGFSRSLTVRLILEQYYKLKDKGIDILKMEVNDIVKKVKK